MEMQSNRIPRFDFSVPPLDAEEQRLVDAYQEIGRPVDDLPYTDDFERMRQLLGVPDSNENKHYLYKRLLGLRKRGRLPRVMRGLD